MNLFGDLRSPGLMYLKAALFLLAGSVSAGTLLWESPTLRSAFLLAVAIGSFCRLYYFAFYVIERWIVPGYHFAGLGSFVLYLLQRRGAGRLPD
jgi:hypothetical protein